MTELVWEGKYRDGKRVAPVRVALPFQTVETVNEGSADRHMNLDLFARGRPTEWRNRLIWGDKKYVLPSLLPEFAGKVNLVYIDPPFDTGADFSFTTEVPGASVELLKEPSLIEQKAYRDTWGRGLDSYLQWFRETALMLCELLTDNGSIYVHLDWHVSHYAKAVMDEVFGADNFVNEIIWRRKQAAAWQSNRFGITNDTIFLYVKGEAYTFNPLYSRDDDNTQRYIRERFVHDDGDGRKYMKSPLVNPLPRPNLRYVFHDVEPPQTGWLYSKERMEGMFAKNELVMPESPKGRIYRKIYADSYEGQVIQNIWTDIPIVNPMASERLGFPTQKPEALLERIVKTSSNSGDLVLDCFCGSGTTPTVAEKLGRHWIACDLGRFAVHTTRKRLLGIAGVKPFMVQNLGKYERQAWMAAEFEEPEDRAATEEAYRRFILDLFHAEPISGSAWVHGVKGGRMVHVGAVDAPVTLADVKTIAREVWRMAGSVGKEGRAAAVDILAWEFAFELNETAKEIAAEARVDVKFRKIPREVLEKKAVDQGDVQEKDFFELRALSTKVTTKKRAVTLELTDFILPAEDLPEDVSKAVKHWSQWIDYWAVDWDYRKDTFHNEWQSYRSREKPDLELCTRHEYKEPGEYVVVVKVIDILGNDTTKAIPVLVK